MKTVWRVVYIIYATILLAVVLNISLQYQEQKYFESEGQKALASTNKLERFYFFYGSLGYHTKSPVLLYETPDFILTFYEVYRSESDIPIFYIMLYPQYEGFKPDDRVLYTLSFHSEDGTVKPYNFDQFRNLQMYVLVNSLRHAEISIKEIQDLKPTKITVNKRTSGLNEQNEIVVKNEETDIMYHITETDLIIENAIKEVGKDDDLLHEKGIFPQFYHSMKKFSYIVYTSLAATLIAIVLGAYFLFFFRRGKKAPLGRRETTESFKNFRPKEYEIKDPLLVEDEDEDSK